MRNIFETLLAHRKNISIVVLGQFLIALGSLFGTRLVTEFISPEVFGRYKILIAGISLIAGLLIRPFIQFAMREYHDAEKQGLVKQYSSQIKTIFQRYVNVLAIGLSLIIVIALLLTNGLTILAIVFSLVFFVLQSNIEFSKALLITRNRQLQANMIGVFQQWVVPIAIVTGITLIQESVSIIMVSSIIVLGSLHLFIKYFRDDNIGYGGKHGLYRDKKELVSSAIVYGKPLAAVGLLGWVVQESDRYLLLYYHSEEVVGIYAAAYGLASAPFTLAVGMAANILYPIIFRLHARDDSDNKLKAVIYMLVVSITISLLGIVGILLFEGIILNVGLGERYRAEAAELLIWIAVGYSFLAVAMTFDLTAYGEKKTSDMFISWGFASILNLAINLLLIPEYGAIGAACATTIALFGYLLSMTILFYSRFKMSRTETVTVQDQ